MILWLVPIDATTLPVKLPFDSTIDRFEILVLGMTWVLALGAAGSYGPRWRHSKANLGLAVFLAIATASVVLNLTAVARAEELQLALKKLSLLGCYAAFFVVVATSLRRREVPRFAVLLVVLAAVAAVGTVIEYRTGVNYFYHWAARLPFVSVAPEPPDPKYARPSIVGPTHHGLAIATILVMVMPLAIVGLASGRTRFSKLLYALALGLLLAGTVATLRKTALVLPAVVVVVLTVYRPRQMARLAPLGIALIVAMQAISPGALAGIRYQLEGGSRLSTEGRTSDYAAVVPDIANSPVIGSGFGTYDPTIFREQHRDERHRILDNQLLMLLIEAGLVGVLAYLGVGLLGIASLNSTARLAAEPRAGPALAVVAATCAFLVSNLLFDTLAFPQVPYVFFFLLGLGIVAAQDVPERRRHPGPDG